MSKRWKTTRPVLVGDPEHVISAERAKELLANNMKYAATGPAPRAITHDFLDYDHHHTLDKKARAEHWARHYGPDVGATTKFGKAADILSNNVINRLSNNGQYDQFTLESIASMTDDFVEVVGNPKNAQAVSDAISQQPDSNGKIYTTHQLLRTEKAVLDDYEYQCAAHHMLSDAYYPRTWRQGDFETVVPQGSEDLVKGAIDEVHSRDELTNREWTDPVLRDAWERMPWDQKMADDPTLAKVLDDKPVIQGNDSFEPDDEQLYARNHTQRVSQTNVAREAVEQDLDPEHVEAMKRYYEADNNDELVEIMGDDDSLFEAHTEDGKVLEGKEALMQNVNKIHDENLTMNFGAGLDDLSDMGREYEYTLPDGKHVKVGQADGPYTTAYIDDNDENLTTDFGDGLDALSGDMEQRESEHTLPDGMI